MPCELVYLTLPQSAKRGGKANRDARKRQRQAKKKGRR